MATPSQPSFWAYLSSSDNNVTGDGSLYDIICDTVSYDNYSQYNSSTGVFTAAYPRMYEVSGVITVSGIGLLHSGVYFNLVTSGGTKRIFALVPSSAVLSGLYTASFSRQILFNTNETAYLQVVVTGSSKTVDVIGGTSPYTVEFGATLVS